MTDNELKDWLSDIVDAEPEDGCFTGDEKQQTQEAAPPRNPHTKTGKVDLVGSVHLALSVDTVGRKARADLLYGQARSLYDAALTEAIAEVGCSGLSGPGHLSGGVELTALKKRAEWSAASIAKTYNKDLLTMVEAAEADWVEGHGSKKGMTRLWLAKTVQPAIKERDTWKEMQIGVTENTWVNDKARQDFFGRNQIEGEMRVSPQIAVCPICQEYVRRGWMKISEAVTLELPNHPGCPHTLEARPLKESIPDCASLWRGQVKTGRKSESTGTAELVKVLEFNPWHDARGRFTSAGGGGFAEKGLSTSIQQLRHGLETKLHGPLIAQIRKAKPELSNEDALRVLDVMALGSERFTYYNDKFKLGFTPEQISKYVTSQKDVDRQVLRKRALMQDQATQKMAGNVMSMQELPLGVRDKAFDAGKKMIPDVQAGQAWLKAQGITVIGGVSGEQSLSYVQALAGIVTTNKAVRMAAKDLKTIRFEEGVLFNTPAATADYNRKTIAIYTNGGPPMAGVWTHELGHFVNDRYAGNLSSAPSRQLQKAFTKGKRVSSYAFTNADEGFAESFVAVTGGGTSAKWLRTNSPEQYKLVIAAIRVSGRAKQ